MGTKVKIYAGLLGKNRAKVALVCNENNYNSESWCFYESDPEFNFFWSVADKKWGKK